ncbi:MAG TPA: UDP-N-acetylmuramate--alanine ligase [Burkholderiales bacterium]|nr:UDP-N-acetylmuramate--alanine ligase [Burkholderiales bacterium]
MKINPTRELVAQLAAQLICEHGVRDFASAKRKAARQLGIAEPHHLPGNPEIEAAVKSYHALFQSQTHPAVLRELRQAAIDVMQALAEFQPYLTGAVLNGTAGKHSDIRIELYTDNEKEVELYLLNQNIQFKQGQQQISHQGGRKQIPCFILDYDICDIYITVHPLGAIRNAPRSSNCEPLKRASLSQVLALIEDSANSGSLL